MSQICKQIEDQGEVALIGDEKTSEVRLSSFSSLYPFSNLYSAHVKMETNANVARNMWKNERSFFVS